MSSKLPNKALSLKQFMLRQEVLKLYRQIFRALRKIPDVSTRKELTIWARSDFHNNKHLTDEADIKARLYYGQKSLKDLQTNLAMSS